MEVHPPEHPIFTWKQFFIHMTTIVLGLLIAIGLEQTVEALHRRHERKELRENISRDLEQIEEDCVKNYAWLHANAIWNAQRTKALQVALAKDQRPVAIPSPASYIPMDLLADPSFDTAKSNGTLGLLPDEDVAAFNELDSVIKHFNTATGEDLMRTDTKVEAMYLRFGQPEDEDSGWSQATPEEKHAFVALNAQLSREFGLADGLVLQVYGAAAAIREGKRDLHTLYMEERSDERVKELKSRLPPPPPSPH